MRVAFPAVLVLSAILAACGGSSEGEDSGGGGGSGAETAGQGAAGEAGSDGSGGTRAGSGNAAGGGGTTSGGSASGGTASAGAAGGGDDCDCAGASITWGQDGGHVAFAETSSILPCKTFSHERAPIRTDPPTLSCETMLLGCVDSLGVGDVNAALAHADVQAALAQSPVLFGRDTRPVDGSVLRIDIGGQIIELGLPCAQANGCLEPPAGVSALSELLSLLEQQELAKEPCSSVFESP